METPMMVRWNEEVRKEFAQLAAEAMLEFVTTHYRYDPTAVALE